MQSRVPGTLSMFSRKIHWLTENKIQHFTFKDTHIKNHAYQKYDHADQRVKAPNSTNQLDYVHSEYYFAAEAGQPLTGITSIPFLPCQGSSCWISSWKRSVRFSRNQSPRSLVTHGSAEHDPPTDPNQPRFFFVIFRLLHSFAYLDELVKFPTDHRVHLEKT